MMKMKRRNWNGLPDHNNKLTPLKEEQHPKVKLPQVAHLAVVSMLTLLPPQVRLQMHVMESVMILTLRQWVHVQHTQK